ncbi:MULTISPECIES: cupin domain-containing protein [Olsenella]|uniref:cupin domain-containing protein n=1 Tax=Olsenella TaxID=133925 RepID=UPI000231F04B|nr:MULTISPECIES: cupin domain-containing protein [Olsenella]EHF02429.1 hypothetical protein HMPREF1008_00834 [Olsenella sp. oral taxon 809 str. F0356]KXB61517.1 hypothetical protein HMPREF1868_02068 [Olsenella sp. DNF00959]
MGKSQNGVTVFLPQDLNPAEHVFVSPRSGAKHQAITLHDDPKTGMNVQLTRYEKGMPLSVHTHESGKGMYVLRGTLHTDQGDLPAGSFVWWDAGTPMFHGATAAEDVDVLFIMDGPFDISYTGDVERV